MAHPHLLLHARIAEECGYDIGRSPRILDFGCGDGTTVRELRALGYDAFGVDIKLPEENAFLRLIPPGSDYRIPFPDETFDFVYSDQVLEHVQDHRIAFAEIERVLKPGGVSLHLFPPKYRPVEPHTFVPLGGIVQARGWLWLWALAGIRNQFQNGLPFPVVAERNYEYLHGSTRYLTKRTLRSLSAPYFADVRFVERFFIKHSYGRARRLYPIARLCPGPLAFLFSSIHQRVVLLGKRGSGAPS